MAYRIPPLYAPRSDKLWPTVQAHLAEKWADWHAEVPGVLRALTEVATRKIRYAEWQPLDDPNEATTGDRCTLVLGCPYALPIEGSDDLLNPYGPGVSIDALARRKPPTEQLSAEMDEEEAADTDIPTEALIDAMRSMEPSTPGLLREPTVVPLGYLRRAPTGDLVDVYVTRTEAEALIRSIADRLREVYPQPTSTLNRDDVVRWVDFIEQCARQFPQTPKLFVGMGEEKLRDVLVNTMNGGRPGSTTSETYSKLGKTDIYIRIDPETVLVCECKLWNGAKAYGKAVDQLFGYLTWRQDCGVMITFCKRKGMTKAITDAQQAIKEHATCEAGHICTQSISRFTSRHVHPQDADRKVDVHHLFFDLSV